MRKHNIYFVICSDYTTWTLDLTLTQILRLTHYCDIPLLAMFTFSILSVFRGFCTVSDATEWSSFFHFTRYREGIVATQQDVVKLLFKAYAFLFEAWVVLFILVKKIEIRLRFDEVISKFSSRLYGTRCTSCWHRVMDVHCCISV